MPVIKVQTKSGSTASGTSITVTLDRATTAGNLLAVSIGWRQPGTAILPTTSDNKGNAYAAASDPGTLTASAGSASIHYAVVTTGGSSHQVTVTFSAAVSNWTIVVAEYSGLTAAPLDQKVNQNNGSGTAIATGSTPVLAQTDELVLACAFTSGAGATFTDPTGYSRDSYVTATTCNLVTHYKCVDATTAVSASWTASVTGSYGSAIATFKANAAILGTGWNEKYVRADAAGGGDGSADTPASAWTFTEACQQEAAGMRINVRSGTHSLPTGRNLNGSGTTTQPIWWRGYNTTPGDVDADQTLTKPRIALTAGALIIQAGHHILCDLDIVSSNGNASTLSGNTWFRIDRCRVENTATGGSLTYACSSSSGITASRCWFKCAGTVAGAAASKFVSAGSSYHRCVFESAAAGLICTGTGTAIGCVFKNIGSDGISSAGTTLIVDGCSFYNVTGDGIKFTSMSTGVHSISNCIFSQCGGYGINNSTGVLSNAAYRHNNLFHACTPENGFGDSPDFSRQTDSSSPFVNPPTDLSLIDSSNAKARGSPYPGSFENQAYTGYLDIGAVQRQEPAGGGGGGGAFAVIGSPIVRATP